MSLPEEAVDDTDDNDHESLAYATVHARPAAPARIDVVDAFDGEQGVCKLRLETADLRAGAFLTPADAQELGEDLLAYAENAEGDHA
jgi:hypothetical protein